MPRALEAGVDVTGVSVLFTVFEMDAGPIVARTELLLDGNEKAPSPAAAAQYVIGGDALLSSRLLGLLRTGCS